MEEFKVKQKTPLLVVKILHLNEKLNLGTTTELQIPQRIPLTNGLLHHYITLYTFVFILLYRIDCCL